MWTQQQLGQRSLYRSPNFLGSIFLNMLSVCCLLAFGLLSSALDEGNLSGVKRLRRDIGGLEKSDLFKRSAGLNEQTCTALPGTESALHNSTNSVSRLLDVY